MNPRLLCLLALVSLAAAQAEPLPGTRSLTLEGDLSDQMVSGVDAWLLQRIAESPAGRAHYWHRDLSSPEAYVKSVEPNRERFKKMIGIVDPRVEGGVLEVNSEPLALSHPLAGARGRLGRRHYSTQGRPRPRHRHRPGRCRPNA